MKMFKYEDKLEERFSLARKYCTKNDLFLDIETTGFSREHCKIYLVSLAYLEKNIIHISQFLSDSDYDEKELLLNVFSYANDFDSVVTYNGKAFDIPFLNDRARFLSVDSPLNEKKEKDLYITAKNLHFLYDGIGLKLKSIEKFLGINRKDTFGGGELIEVYKKYINLSKLNSENDPFLSERIQDLQNELLLHNYEDVKNLVPLMVLKEYEKLLKPKVEIENFVLSESDIIFLGKINASLPNPFLLKNDYCLIRFEESKIKGTIKLIEGKIRYYLPDFKNYFYLPEEKTILPKSMASAVPKTRRRSATMEECFIEKNPQEVDSKLLKTYAENVIKNLIKYGS